MKVIFLDIDGVMNSQLYYESTYRMRWARLETYKWYIISKLRYIKNGFKNKGITLRELHFSKKHHEFEYLFKRLKSQTDPKAWMLLSHLIKDTQAKICISSVWKRHFNTHEEWNKALILLGIDNGTYVGITGERRSLRGSEIKEWIDNNKQYNIEKYAIIDDDNDMLIEQMSSFFLTDPYCGLSPNICYRIKLHFNN